MTLRPSPTHLRRPERAEWANGRTRPTVNRREVPREKFPFVIEALHPKTRAVVWSVTVEMPKSRHTGRLVEIPPLRQQLGHPVAMRIRYADGEVDEREPDPVN